MNTLPRMCDLPKDIDTKECLDRAIALLSKSSDERDRAAATLLDCVNNLPGIHREHMHNDIDVWVFG